MHVILGPAYTVHLAAALEKHLECQLQLLAPCMQSPTGGGGIGAADAAVRYADTRAALWSEVDNLRHMCKGDSGTGVSTSGVAKGGFMKGVAYCYCCNSVNLCVGSVKICRCAACM